MGARVKKFIHASLIYQKQFGNKNHSNEDIEDVLTSAIQQPQILFDEHYLDYVSIDSNFYHDVLVGGFTGVQFPRLFSSFSS